MFSVSWFCCCIFHWCEDEFQHSKQSSCKATLSIPAFLLLLFLISNDKNRRDIFAKKWKIIICLVWEWYHKESTDFRPITEDKPFRQGWQTDYFFLTYEIITFAYFFILLNSAKDDHICCLKKLTCLIYHGVTLEWIFKLESSFWQLRGGG